jgi:hypothetical protein
MLFFCFSVQTIKMNRLRWHAVVSDTGMQENGLNQVFSGNLLGEVKSIRHIKLHV